jgi:hypothetical protein
MTQVGTSSGAQLLFSLSLFSSLQREGQPPADGSRDLLLVSSNGWAGSQRKTQNSEPGQGEECGSSSLVSGSHADRDLTTQSQMHYPQPH